MADRKDPYGNYNFLVEMDGQVVAGFKKVSGGDSTVQPIKYREGGEKYFPVRQLDGPVDYTNIVLETGVTDDNTLYEWHQQWVKADPARKRKLVRIVLLDRAGVEKKSWKVREAWPTKYKLPSFDAEAHDVAIQTLELAHEGIDLE